MINMYFYKIYYLERIDIMKTPFITKEKAEEIIKQYPTPFHIYDEKGIRQRARDLYKAFSWNKRLQSISL